MIALIAGIVALCTPGPDLSTPAATLQSFVSAVSEVRFEDASLCVQGGVYRESAKPLEKELRSAPISWTAEIKSATVEGDDATMICTSSFHLPNHKDAPPLVGEEETLTLHHDSDGWRFVSRSIDEIVKHYNEQKDRPDDGSPRKIGYLGAFISAFRYEEFMVGMAKGFLTGYHQGQALLKMKNLGVALLLLTVDKDDVFPASQEDFKKLIAPYLEKSKNEDALDPLEDHDGVVWLLNPTVFGVSAEVIEHPEKVVVLYESDHGQLGFNYQGKALVGMADGSAHLVTKDQSLKLLWQPKN